MSEREREREREKERERERERARARVCVQICMSWGLVNMKLFPPVSAELGKLVCLAMS